MLTKFLLYARMTRPGFLLVTPLACGLGLASAHAAGSSLNAPLALLTVVLATALHAAANVLNDYEDHRNGADAANSSAIRPFSGGAGLIQAQEVTAQQTRQFAFALFAVVAIGGLWLLAQVGVGILYVGLAGVLLAWAYSAPPLVLMSRGLGELAVALAWWLMVLGADFVQRQSFALEPLLLGAPYACLMANVLLINGLPDAAADAQVGKRTLVVRLGARGAAALYALLLFKAAAVLWFAQCYLGLPATVLWALAPLLLGVVALVCLLRAIAGRASLKPAIVLTILTVLLHGAVLMLALFLASVV